MKGAHSGGETAARQAILADQRLTPGKPLLELAWGGRELPRGEPSSAGCDVYARTAEAGGHELEHKCLFAGMRLEQYALPSDDFGAKVVSGQLRLEGVDNILGNEHRAPIVPDLRGHQ